ncbi:MAG: helix-turn-helix transcriptional regulator [Bacilli bacterium]|jgi:transcriptional regulator with XRE-family HTH domain|nr:helix-turn-helix transcriptional regulator [Bacilli bacterium]
MTQEALGEKIQLSNEQISTFETGSRGITLDNLVAIAQALSTSLDYLVFGNGERVVTYVRPKPKNTDLGHRVGYSLAVLMDEKMLSYDLIVGFELNFHYGNAGAMEFIDSYSKFISKTSDYLSNQSKAEIYESLVRKLNDDLTGDKNK